MERCLQEFRVRGVKTNIPFLINLVTHTGFLSGEVTTRFLDETPELFNFPTRQDRASKLLSYIAEVIVNGHPEVREGKQRNVARPIVEARTRRRFRLARLHRHLLFRRGPEIDSRRWARRDLHAGCSIKSNCS